MKIKLTKTLFSCLALVAPMPTICLSSASCSNSNYCVIKWINDDSSILKEEKVLKNTMPKFEGTPVSAKQEVGYLNKFIGWNKEIKTVTCNETYQAVYQHDAKILELPILNITTEGQQPIESKEVYLNANIKLSNTEQSYCFDISDCQIKGRGNSSWYQSDKKSYKIKFATKQSIFGSSYKAKKWNLIPNYFDRSLIRNLTAYKLSSYMDNICFAPAINMVDVYLNGSFRGIYMLSDQVEVNPGRIDIDKTIDPTGDNGFLFELNTADQLPGKKVDQDYLVYPNTLLEIKSPDTSSQEYLDNLTNEITFIKGYLNNVFNALAGNNWNDITTYINVDSFVDGYVVEEIFANIDCWAWSMFYYKDKGGKFTHGPVWDFDIGAGNCNYGPGRKETMPADERLWAGTENYIYKCLLKFDEFKTLVTNKLKTFKPIFTENMNYIDPNNKNGLYAKYEKSFERNFVKWPIMQTEVWPAPDDVNALKNIKEHQTFLKNWLEKRYAYLETIYK